MKQHFELVRLPKSSLISTAPGSSPIST